MTTSQLHLEHDYLFFFAFLFLCQAEEMTMMMLIMIIPVLHQLSLMTQKQLIVWSMLEGGCDESGE